ncbi:uncharacterized protein Veg [Streptohalobacillus salinus]|uniref:Uncharacterized protein Veg n=1 Tax=Streptohalobacillus salinus TaxID=621096 RepID=A0A2V3W5L0_9BACI|nr:Veg family protein [Streptohalobacillus salinus]PXW88474.1 uncharacterized protein Veg [Streptohalobacillus salinus]
MAKTLVEIKRGLDGQIGKRLQLIANGGRKKTVERYGTLEETYNAVFIVALDQDENAFERVSYSYADVLTEAVELNFIEENNMVAVGEQ